MVRGREPHHIQLPVALAEEHPRDAVAVRVPADRGPEPLTDLVQRREGRDREPARVRVPRYLPARLQRGHMSVEVDAVEPLNMPTVVKDEPARTMTPAEPPTSMV